MLIRWKQYLLQLEIMHDIVVFSVSQGSYVHHRQLNIEQEFKTRYPGNYWLDWRYDSTDRCFHLYPYFPSIQDENWWHLKYD